MKGHWVREGYLGDSRCEVRIVYSLFRLLVRYCLCRVLRLWLNDTVLFFWKAVLELVDGPFVKGGSCGIGKKCNTIMNIILGLFFCSERLDVLQKCR